MKTVFAFPGMGSQYRGMGAAFFRNLRTFRDQIESLDEQFVRAGGRSFRSIIADPAPPGAQLLETSLSGVAIFAVEWAMASVLREMDFEPDLTLGASLGVFAAMAVAGGISPGEALHVIHEQGKVVEKACQDGAMVAALASVDRLLGDAAISRLTEVAGVNFAGHCVLSMPREHLSEVQSRLRELDIVQSVLPVRRAFHSRWIDASREGLIGLFSTLEYRPPRVPVVCCSSGQPIHSLSEQTVWGAVRGPILFADTITRLEAQEPHRYVDCGPSATLATFLKYLLPASARSRILPLMAPFGDDMASLAVLATTLLRDHATQARAASPPPLWRQEANG